MNKIGDNDVFSDEDLELLISLCASLNVYVLNVKKIDRSRADLQAARLSLETVESELRESAAARATAQSMLERSRILVQTAAALSHTKDTANLFGETVLHARKVCSADRGGTLFILDVDTNELFSRIAEGYGGEVGHEIRLAIDAKSLSCSLRSYQNPHQHCRCVSGFPFQSRSGQTNRIQDLKCAVSTRT